MKINDLRDCQTILQTLRDDLLKMKKAQSDNQVILQRIFNELAEIDEIYVEGKFNVKESPGIHQASVAELLTNVHNLVRQFETE